ncbi:MAG: VOC family protein [Acidobacteria bacterium]|nr:VOC family protein [Acidobacteriota bacterium]
MKQSGVKLNGKLGDEKFVLDHLGVAVESLAKAVDFYERTLGLSVSG